MYWNDRAVLGWDDRAREQHSRAALKVMLRDSLRALRSIPLLGPASR